MIINHLIEWVSGIFKRASKNEQFECLRGDVENLADIKKNYPNSETFAKLEESLHNLYATFAGCKKPRRLNCCYPDDKKAQNILDYNQHEAPIALIGRLEFYEKHWCKSDEVKYLLPRLMEIKAIKLISLIIEGNLYCSFGELAGGAFLSNALMQPGDWSESEQQAISNYMYSLLEFVLHNAIEIHHLVDALSHVVLTAATITELHYADNQQNKGFTFDINKLFMLWDKVAPELRKKQFQSYMNSAYSNGYFTECSFNDISVTSWVVSDKHIVELDLCDDAHYSTMIVNDAIYKKAN